MNRKRLVYHVRPQTDLNSLEVDISKIKSAIEQLKAPLTEAVQSSVREKMSQPGLVKRFIGYGALVTLGVFALPPLLPVVAAGVPAAAVTEGVTGFAAGISGNVVATWIDDTAKDWAGIRNPTEENLEKLAIGLKVGLVQYEKLRPGLIILLEKAKALTIAVEELKKLNTQGNAEIMHEINKLRSGIEKKISPQSLEGVSEETQNEQERQRPVRTMIRQPSSPSHSISVKKISPQRQSLS